MDDLALYDADDTHTVPNIADTAAWIASECARLGVGPLHRMDAHRMHGTLIQRGVTTREALHDALTQYIAHGVSGQQGALDKGW